ncbi:hypothetical protein, partial [Bartonella fuyuanensis]|uniref:hypothetical protein n=1 Tax=Bartonella fuyuanensis TaxID=1460968 RepID=UPI001AEE5580
SRPFLVATGKKQLTFKQGTHISLKKGNELIVKWFERSLRILIFYKLRLFGQQVEQKTRPKELLIRNN